MYANLHISPDDAMIAPDFLCLRMLATDGIAAALPEGGACLPAQTGKGAVCHVANAEQPVYPIDGRYVS